MAEIFPSLFIILFILVLRYIYIYIYIYIYFKTTRCVTCSYDNPYFFNLTELSTGYILLYFSEVSKHFNSFSFDCYAVRMLDISHIDRLWEISSMRTA